MFLPGESRFQFPNPIGESSLELDDARANFHTHELRPANDFTSGASPYGALQMVGNVWEFVDDLREPSDRALAQFATLLRPAPTRNEPWYAIRGGSNKEDMDLPDEILWDTTTVPSRWKSTNLGFRCVKDSR